MYALRGSSCRIACLINPKPQLPGHQHPSSSLRGNFSTFMLGEDGKRTYSTNGSEREGEEPSKEKPSLPFAADDFDADRYLSNRPRYPSHLYSVIRSCLAPAGEVKGIECAGTLLDLGCGPGFASFPLLDDPRFNRLIGIDTSQKMIESAPRAYQAWLSYLSPDMQQRKDLRDKDVSFLAASSSELRGIVEDNSVTLALAATAAHWFNLPATWAELTRVVKPGGSVVFMTYGEHYLPRHPELLKHILFFMQGDSTRGDSIGPFFPQPGRNHLLNLLQDIPFPHQFTEKEISTASWMAQQWDISSAIRKVHPMESRGRVDLSWLSSPNSQTLPVEAEPFRLEEVMSWEKYASYIRSSSAFHTCIRECPNVLPTSAEETGVGDIASRFVESMKTHVIGDRRRGVGVEVGVDEDHVRVAWPLGLMSIRKKTSVQ